MKAMCVQSTVHNASMMMMLFVLNGDNDDDRDENARNSNPVK